MESQRHALLTLICVPVLLAGCGTTTGGRELGVPQDGVRHEGAGFVITGSALEDGPGNLLETLVGKIPNFRIQRNSGGCPIIHLRGAVGLQGNPHVYVDGTRTTDTCVLTSLRTVDVSRIEVYPMGFTTRPGYGTHAHGLILVFMRSAGG